MVIVEKTIDSTFESVHCFVMHVLNIIDKMESEKTDGMNFKLNIVLREILNNAVEHGNKFDKDKSVYCKIELLSDHLIITVQDEGRGFNKKEIRTNDLNPLKRRNRGFDIIEKYDFDYEIEQHTIKLRYNFKED